MRSRAGPMRMLGSARVWRRLRWLCHHMTSTDQVRPDPLDQPIVGIDLRPRRRAQVPAGAGPDPVGRPEHQAARHRVAVDVQQFTKELVLGPHVPVESATGLPESSTVPGDRELGEHPRVQLAPALHQALGHRLLDGPEDPRHIGRVVVGTEEQVNVLGHQHPRVEPEPMSLAGRGQRIDEHLADRRRGEQRQAAVTGEGEEPDLSDDLAPAEPLADRSGIGADLHNPRIRGSWRPVALTRRSG